MQNGRLFPKIKPLPGSLHAEYKQCGKPRCRCTRGRVHGPYWYRRWRDDGRQRKAYIPRDRVAAVQAAIARWRQLHPPARTMRDTLAGLRRLLKEMG